jgi:hypothetical protein
MPQKKKKKNQTKIKIKLSLDPGTPFLDVYIQKN